MNKQVDKLYTPDEVANILQVKTTTVKEWLRNGVIVGMKINGHMWRVQPDELSKFIENKTKGA